MYFNRWVQQTLRQHSWPSLYFSALFGVRFCMLCLATQLPPWSHMISRTQRPDSLQLALTSISSISQRFHRKSWVTSCPRSKLEDFQTQPQDLCLKLAQNKSPAPQRGWFPTADALAIRHRIESWHGASHRTYRAAGRGFNNLAAREPQNGTTGLPKRTFQPSSRTVSNAKSFTSLRHRRICGREQREGKAVLCARERSDHARTTVLP